MLNLKLIIDKTPIMVLSVYRSPSRNKFLTVLFNIINKEKYTSGYLIITGDMNINIIGNNEYLDKLSEYGFVSYINVYENPD